MRMVTTVHMRSEIFFAAAVGDYCLLEYDTMDKPAASIFGVFYPEDGGRIFVQNSNIYQTMLHYVPEDYSFLNTIHIH